MIVSFDIAEGVKNRVIDAICARHGYQVTIDGAPNPQTKGQFVKSVMITFLKNTVSDYEQEQALMLARNAAKAKAEADISIS